MTSNMTIRPFAHTIYRLAGKLFPATVAGLIFNRIWLAMLLCAGMTVAAHAQSYYTVDCTGANPNAFPTITSALQVAGPGAYVIIASPCSENVVISNLSNLNVGAYYGSTVNINGSITITGSNSVFLYGLNVTNASGNAFTVTSSHNVTLWTCTGNGSSGNGLSAQNLSDITVNGPGSFDNNGSEGINLNSNSVLGVSTWGGPVDISNNQSQGVVVGSGSLFSSLGNTTIKNNQITPGAPPRSGFGITGVSEAKIQMGTCFGPIEISGNPGGGVGLEENAELAFWNCGNAYQSYITGNGPVGISAGYGSQVTLWDDAQISGHTGSGVELYGNSQMHVFGPNLITGNGSASDPRSAGIVVDGNSEAYLRGGQITSNEGPGILALVNSSADFTGATFSGNSGGIISCDSSAFMVSDMVPSTGRPPAGVVCRIPHNLGNRHSQAIASHTMPDVTAQKKKAAQYKVMAVPKA
jgi:Right handed beta helix region